MEKLELLKYWAVITMSLRSGLYFKPASPIFAGSSHYLLYQVRLVNTIIKLYGCTDETIKLRRFAFATVAKTLRIPFTTI